MCPEGVRCSAPLSSAHAKRSSSPSRRKPSNASSTGRRGTRPPLLDIWLQPKAENAVDRSATRLGPEADEARDDASRRPAVAEKDVAPRPRQKLPRLGPQASDRLSMSSEREANSLGSQLLRHIPAIRQENLDDPLSRLGADVRATESETVDDPSRYPNVDDHAQAHANRDASVPTASSGEQDECAVIPRLGPTRRPHPDAQRRAATCLEDEAPWPHTEPGVRGSAPVQRDDFRAPAKIEGEARAGDIHHNALGARVRDPYGRATRALERHVGGRRRQSHRRPRTRHARRSRRDQEKGGNRTNHGRHLPMTVKVTVAV
jgi:hypothetical protein